ncbi:MAG TPA: single-stranded-DNA-specific exonuclease RecJ [Pirellulaceae bacterium]|nr:single-stranded-DNA-specific exonuclease RecJ [Pirellulaceae bacterium]
MSKRWRIYPHDTARVAQLERAAGVPPVVAQLLVARGIYQPEQARLFLDAKLTGLRDPDLLPGVNEVADRLHAALNDKRRVVVYGDYDCDGMTAASILYRCLKLLGGDVGYYVPNRLDEGYGLNDEALRTLASRGAQTVITVDCGIASVREADTARELGLELLITDHHEFGTELPRAVAIAHPRLPGTNYPFGGLCGAGVALKVAWALCQRVCQAKRVTDAQRDFLLTAVGYASIGTVADVVPLVDENRVLVRHGVQSLFSQPTVGLAALLKVTGLDKKSALSSEDIAFTIAPRLNAAGRLGQAQLGIELLVTDSVERAEALANYIHELNNSRDSLERSIYLAALKQAQEQFDPEHDPALVLSGRNWHVGVIGIVAGRLAEKFHRPVILISLDALGGKPGVGSARSANGLQLHEALRACEVHLAGHGGHAAAAGLKIDEGRIDAFRAEFCEYAATAVTPQQRIAELAIDAEAMFSQLTPQIVRQIEQLAPFGAGNPRPVLCASNVQLVEPPKRMGGGERHLSAKLIQHGTQFRAVAFGHGDWADELAQVQGPLEIAYRPVINEFRGRQSVEVQLVDWRPAATPAVTL